LFLGGMPKWEMIPQRAAWGLATGEAWMPYWSCNEA
jgi:hypothetical protein